VAQLKAEASPSERQVAEIPNLDQYRDCSQRRRRRKPADVARIATSGAALADASVLDDWEAGLQQGSARG
jgi:hypothetical protein